MKKKLVKILIRVLVPLVIGTALFLITMRSIYPEITFLVFGLFGLMGWISQMNRLDRKNLKNLGTTKRDKTSQEYLEYIQIQHITLISAAINLALSYFTFLFLGAFI